MSEWKVFVFGLRELDPRNRRGRSLRWCNEMELNPSALASRTRGVHSNMTE
jgi:hypothetical protein